MKEISVEKITEEVAKLCVKANLYLSDDVKGRIKASEEAEKGALGKQVIGQLMENMDIAESSQIPICQDTGMAVFFVEIGQEVHIDGSLTDAINAGVRKGYEEGYLRKSVVSDPILRVNTGDNTPAIIHYDVVPGDKLDILIAPKGFGSENMSAMKMFLPSCSQADIEDFIVETVKKAGALPWPPVGLGVGLGGTVELAALTAKKALIRPADRRNADPYYAEMEKRVLGKINALGIGAQGFGGAHTALAVNIDAQPTHIAGLPCVVNMGCHVTRHASGCI